MPGCSAVIHPAGLLCNLPLPPHCTIATVQMQMSAGGTVMVQHGRSGLNSAPGWGQNSTTPCTGTAGHRQGPSREGSCSCGPHHVTSRHATGSTATAAGTQDTAQPSTARPSSAQHSTVHSKARYTARVAARRTWGPGQRERLQRREHRRQRPAAVGRVAAQHEARHAGQAGRAGRAGPQLLRGTPRHHGKARHGMAPWQSTARPLRPNLSTETGTGTGAGVGAKYRVPGGALPCTFHPPTDRPTRGSWP